MKVSPSQIVLEYYKDAISVKVNNHYEIQSNGMRLGQGKNKRCAWLSASRNINN